MSRQPRMPSPLTVVDTLWIIDGEPAHDLRWGLAEARLLTPQLPNDLPKDGEANGGESDLEHGVVSEVTGQDDEASRQGSAYAQPLQRTAKPPIHSRKDRA